MEKIVFTNAKIVDIKESKKYDNILSITIDTGETIVFDSTMYDDSVYLSEVSGVELKDIVGEEIYSITKTGIGDPDDHGQSGTKGTFYDIKTKQGITTLTFQGCEQMYYSAEVGLTIKGVEDCSHNKGKKRFYCVHNKEKENLIVGKRDKFDVFCNRCNKVVYNGRGEFEKFTKPERDSFERLIKEKEKEFLEDIKFRIDKGILFKGDK